MTGRSLYSAMGRITGDGFSNQEMIEQLSGGPGGPGELRWRAHKAFKLARDIVRNLEDVENRRNVFVYLSSGYDFNPYEYERFRQSPIGRAIGSIQEAATPTTPSTRASPTATSTCST